MTGGIGRSLAGAWHVMNGRADGLAALDLSIQGFWRSFGAVVLIAPLALLDLASERTVAARLARPIPELDGSSILLNLAALLVYWLAFPLLFAALASSIGVAGRYVHFIVARNWSIVIMAAFVGAAAVLLFAPLPVDVYFIVLMVLFGAELRFAYLLTKVTLAVPPAIALPIVLLDLLMSLLIMSGFERLGT